MTKTIKEFDEYQERATRLAEYPDVGSNFLYPTLGLAGEAGEFADKIKKLWRNRGVTNRASLMSEDDRDTKYLELKQELGDIQWYIAAMCKELGTTLSEIATLNIDKLEDRKKRGAIKGEGDNR